MTRMIVGSPGDDVWIPAAWTRWQIRGVEYRRRRGDVVEFSIDGRQWRQMPSMGCSSKDLPHPLTTRERERRMGVA